MFCESKSPLRSDKGLCEHSQICCVDRVEVNVELCWVSIAIIVAHGRFDGRESGIARRWGLPDSELGRTKLYDTRRDEGRVHLHTSNAQDVRGFRGVKSSFVVLRAAHTGTLHRLGRGSQTEEKCRKLKLRRSSDYGDGGDVGLPVRLLECGWVCDCPLRIEDAGA